MDPICTIYAVSCSPYQNSNRRISYGVMVQTEFGGFCLIIMRLHFLYSCGRFELRCLQGHFNALRFPNVLKSSNLSKFSLATLVRVWEHDCSCHRQPRGDANTTPVRNSVCKITFWPFKSQRADGDQFSLKLSRMSNDVLIGCILPQGSRLIAERTPRFRSVPVSPVWSLVVPAWSRLVAGGL